MWKKGRKKNLERIKVLIKLSGQTFLYKRALGRVMIVLQDTEPEMEFSKDQTSITMSS